MSLYKWSQTANNNASADGTINWAEGQPPSSVNDSARAMMAATAMYRDDISGAIVTGGTTTAYTLSSYSVFDTLAHMSGQMIAFTPHVTNTAGPIVLNVDGLGFRALRSAPGVELPAGVIVAGTPYTATYNNTDGAFYLQNFYGDPFSIPLAAGMPYFATSAPNSSFAFPYGQAISRSTYASLFNIITTIYGPGDGSTTFNLPDLRGRVPAGWDAMGGIAASRLTTASGFSSGLGATAGGETHTLVTAEIPPVPFSGVTSTENQSHTHGGVTTGAAGTYNSPGGATNVVQSVNNSGTSGVENQNHIHSFSGNISGGGGAHPIVQPTIVCNFIIRIL